MYSSDFRGISIRKGIITSDVRLQDFKDNSCLSLQGESKGYTVQSKEKDIAISEYPLLQTEFLYESKKGTAVIFRVQNKRFIIH